MSISTMRGMGSYARLFISNYKKKTKCETLLSMNLVQSLNLLLGLYVLQY